MHSTLSLSPLQSGLFTYNLAITISNLLGNAFTQNTTSAPHWGYGTIFDCEVSPVMVLQHTGKESYIARPHKHTISLSLCWFAPLTMSLKMFLTCGVRRITNCQLLARWCGSSHWPSALSETSLLYENWNAWKSARLKQLNIYIAGEKHNSEGGMLRDVFSNFIRITLVPCTILWEPYIVPLSCLVLLVSWERYGAWAFYNTGAD